MKKIKSREIRYEVYDDDGDKLSGYGEDDFATIQEANNHIENETMGGEFTIWKVEKSRVQINTKKKDIVPCYGGWYGGHTISKEDEENETKNPFCKRCGYKLKVYRSLSGTRCVVVKPLVRIDSIKGENKK